MTLNKQISKKSFVHQQDQSDCGIACLLSIIKYYDGINTFENLRNLSGTNTTGTTLLGLYEAASKLGFTVEGCETNIDLLSNYHSPCILYAHTNHYVICYGISPQSLPKREGQELVFIIGDPAKGIEYWDEKKLTEAWQTKKCLTLVPNEYFKKPSTLNNNKING